MDGKLIVDAGCHLPDGVLARLNITRLSDASAFESCLLNDWIYHGDDWLVLASAPRIHAWQAVLHHHQADIGALRLAARLPRPFRLRFIATASCYSGLGLLAAQLAQLWAAGLSIDAVRSCCGGVEQAVQQSLAVGAASPWLQQLPWQRRWRSTPAIFSLDKLQPRRLGGGRTPLTAVLSYADHAIPDDALINLSVAGKPADIRQDPAFQQASQRRHQAGGLCWLSEMDSVSAHQCGPGALSIAWLKEPLNNSPEAP